MRWRRFLSLPSLARDAGIVVLIAQHIWGGIWAFGVLIAALTFLGGLLWSRVAVMMASAAATHSKAVSTENRLTSFVAETNHTVDAHDTRIGGVEGGVFPNIPGLGTVNMIGTGGAGATLHAGALANLTSGPNTAFLASLNQMASQTGLGGLDTNSGASWATGERGYINECITFINNFVPNLKNNGFMS